jgi:hypothetical protein
MTLPPSPAARARYNTLKIPNLSIPETQATPQAQPPDETP